MSQKHYDVIILGESLTSRVAGVLLARAGRRVLVVGASPGSIPMPAWLPVSLHLERLLETLGGRSCLASPSPFQVLSGDVRLTIHGSSTLDDELRREFVADSNRVGNLLKELEDVGNRLGNALWECGGLPLTGLASRWRFIHARLRRGLTRGRLSRPLAGKLKGFSSPQTSRALAALFSGLSLTPVDRLSAAEGALLWRSFGGGRGISVSALVELLMHRFEQFHGEHTDLATLQSLQTSENSLGAVVFKDGRRCTADVFLLGSLESAARLPDGMQAGPVAASPPALFEGRIDEGRISPLLAHGVILDGSPTLRLTLMPAPDGSTCRLVCEPATSSGVVSSAELVQRLTPLFPFTTLRFDPGADLEPPLRPQVDIRSRRRGFPGAVSTLAAGRNLLHCCGEQVLPSLGATGEILVGVSVANHLKREKRP